MRRAAREIPQHFPALGWVEHDPDDLWRTVVETIEELASAAPAPIAALGLTNQRETTILWDRATGRPVHRAIVWQCRRTADHCRTLAPHADLFRERTGLPLDAYFSGTKIRWILDRAALPPPDRIAFGTVDSWLLWNLTGGAVHATDFTNASRTLLFDIHRRVWDRELAERLDVPLTILPEVRASNARFGEVASIPKLRGVPIHAVIGDQQAALFGQGCFRKGSLKNTYGTGGFLMMNTGAEAVRSRQGLVTTLGVGEDGDACFALEGSVFIAGAALQWLRDGLGVLTSASESEALARSVPDSGGVVFVPAFVGLGAPHWEMDARGAILGLTRGSTRAHVVRAALESLAFQTRDVFEVMRREASVDPPRLRVDGGAAANDFLLQFQADVLDVPVERPRVLESTALGAAALAGVACGVWPDAGAFASTQEMDRSFTPSMDPAHRRASLEAWEHALRQVLAA
jgi:glycerol kinase